MVTVKDVARLAGVSAMTVSNVVHNRKERVSEATYARVMQVIRETGYRPNLVARSLVSRRSRLVAYVCPFEPGRGGFASHPVFARMIAAAEETLRGQGYYLLLHSAKSPAETAEFLQNWAVDGVIFSGFCEPAYAKVLQQTGLPVAVIDGGMPFSGAFQIGLEDEQGGYIATRHLIENGHREILYIGNNFREHATDYRRYTGYCHAMQEAGLPIRPEGRIMAGSGDGAIEKLAARLAAESDATAMVALSDRMAIRLICGLRAAGKRVPEDWSVVGFDDLDWAEWMTPQLTTVHQDIEEKGRIAAQMLLDAFAGKEDQPETALLPVRLVQRNSVKPRGCSKMIFGTSGRPSPTI